jgi:hypothetical protein
MSITVVQLSLTLYFQSDRLEHAEPPALLNTKLHDNSSMKIT